MYCAVAASAVHVLMVLAVLVLIPVLMGGAGIAGALLPEWW